MTPLILGFAGTSLTADERDLFADAKPAGFILFERNIEDPQQLCVLTDQLRAAAGRDNLAILIDQEGGRVQRLHPPHWGRHPTGAAFGQLYDAAPMTAIEAARLHGHALAAELSAVGVTVDCLPLLDVPVPGAHDIIGERAFGTDPVKVASLAAGVLRGLREGGVCGIVKHIPGHGRAGADSHEVLPVVDAGAAELDQDLMPFRRLNDAPMAMTAHVRYDAWDRRNCASVSAAVIGEIIRGEIGFDGLLMCDDLSMKALGGTLPERMTAALEAGCDVALNCTAAFEDNRALVEAAPVMTGDARRRLDAAMAWASDPAEPEPDAARRRDELLGVMA